MKLNWDQAAVDDDVDSYSKNDRWPVRQAVLLIFVVSAVFWGAIGAAVIFLL